MPTKTVNGELIIDVSHPWDRPGTPKHPPEHQDSLPTEDEIFQVLEDLFQHENRLMATFFTYYDPENFLDEGKVIIKENANIP